jgi:RNA polymerase primary sigma factor
MKARATFTRDRSLNRAMRLYLREITKTPLLSPEEEKVLANRARSGDKEALQKLIESNLRFVIRLAKGYRLSGIPLLELINQGNIGLIEAARRFDPDREVRFTTYAAWWIRQAILQYLSQASHIFRVNPRASNVIYRLKKWMRDRQQGGEFPTREVLAQQLGVSLKELNGALEAEGAVVSLDQPIEENGDLRLADTLEQNLLPAPDRAVTSALLSENVDRLLQLLTPTEQTIVRFRFGFDDDDPHTLEQIGKKLRLSRERIRQIEAKALHKLRESLGNSSLSAYTS